MGVFICIIGFIILGIVFFIIYKYKKIKRANLDSLTQILTNNEERKLSVINTNFSLFISITFFIISSALTVIFGVIPLFFKNTSLDDINSASNYNSVAPTVIQNINTTNPENNTETTFFETHYILESTEGNNTIDLYEEKTENSNISGNIITHDCVLEDRLSKSSNKKYYVLKTNYHSEYGFEFSIDDVNLGYSFSIENEKGETVKSIVIPNNSDSYAIELNKNSCYRLIVEAQEGYPQFSITISYPENDNF